MERPPTGFSMLEMKVKHNGLLNSLRDSKASVTEGSLQKFLYPGKTLKIRLK